VQLPTIIPLIFLGPLSEEFGWRGFLQKRLQSEFNPFLTSIIIGLVWSFWHLPLFYMNGTSQHEFGIPFFSFLISVSSSSFVYTYIFRESKGSLFGAIFLHWTGTYPGLFINIA
jgi:membrane protease YdiL (CAAX protease family)